MRRHNAAIEFGIAFLPFLYLVILICIAAAVVKGCYYIKDNGLKSVVERVWDGAETNEVEVINP